MAPPNKLKLPKQLIDQLGVGGCAATIRITHKIQAITRYLLANEDFTDDTFTSHRKSRPPTGTRKDLRKAARTEKKVSKNGPPPTKRKKLYHVQEEVNSRSEEPIPQNHKKAAREQSGSFHNPKSILKATKTADPPHNAPRPLKHPHPVRPVSPPTNISRSVKNKLAEDDEEIASLEKKLGLKGKKKLPQSFKDDGLDELLEGLDEGEDSHIPESKKRKAEGDEWLDRKRREAREASGLRSKDREDDEEDDLSDQNSEDDDGASDMSLDGPEFPDDDSEDDFGEMGDDGMILDADDGFGGFGSDDGDEEDDEQPSRPRVRENPYVAPVTNGDAPQKYIPPSLRKPASSDSEALVQLRRQTQGLVNRLTESNMISILGDIEKLYREHPRQHITSTLVDLLLTSVCEPTSLPDTLIILPAGFIAAIYKIIGMDFGAQIVQRSVELFDGHYRRSAGPNVGTTYNSKETSNIIMLLCELYNFQVIGSNLIFDYIRMFLENLSELHAELLLKIVRTSGPQLRHDDPSSLKDIVAMLRTAVTSAGGEDNLSVRTKFMIETINDLKNNKMKTGGAASAITSEHTIRMKKTLGTLNTRSLKASEPLRIGLKDIQGSDKRGKWWLVGASWSGNAVEESKPSAAGYVSTSQVEDAGTSDLVQLAKEQRMNTDVRRAIFITVMSATDYQDAYLRLTKLKLKKVQEYEIPKVLIHCCGAEKAYNPYYTLVAKKVCSDRKLKTAFQFCLWDSFRKMGESDDDDDVAEDEEDAMDLRRVFNLAKMFGSLIADGSLGLGVLRKLNLSYLQTKTKSFIEVLFVTIFLQSQRQSESKRDEQAVVNVLSQAKDIPELIGGMQYFLRKVVSKTDIAGGKTEKDTVRWACKLAAVTLEAFVAMDK
ncbi:Suppressor of glycerol defect protein [Lachnellula occidentalis]|uniref:Suppressor of glycerol defect protein n=1 Tax=Lachnellula occidentalis TaxID=215460 RepID=A0A8H8S6J9_9HELO|nr:Suppressor of glycerol defect protein [Lachnellula occidentalis]